MCLKKCFAENTDVIASDLPAEASAKAEANQSLPFRTIEIAAVARTYHPSLPCNDPGGDCPDMRTPCLSGSVKGLRDIARGFSGIHLGGKVENTPHSAEIAIGIVACATERHFEFLAIEI